MSKNLAFSQIFRKIAILAKIFENSWYCWKLLKNRDFVHNFPNQFFKKIDFSQKYRKNPNFSENFPNICILLKIYKKSRFLYRKTYSVVQYTLFYNMVLLRLVKHKLQHGVKYIKQNECDKNTGMTQPFSAWNGQHEKGHIIPYMYLRTKCPIK